MPNPRYVARGITLPGFSILLEGTVALSTPRKENRVKAATAVIAERSDFPEILSGVKLARSM